jgi:type III secretion protein V
VIGFVQRGMDLATAARAYTLLTIGEGLVAQIPALVISTAAGIVVTRVASEEEGAHLGRDVGVQVLAHPRALGGAAGLLALLGLIPGLPAIPFLVLAALLGLVAWRLLANPPSSSSPSSSSSSSSSPAPARLVPVTVELSAALAAELGVTPDGGGAFTAAVVVAVGARLSTETGLGLPRVRFVPGVAALPARGYRIALNEIPLARGELPPGATDAAARVGADLLQLLRRRGHELLGIEETQALVAALAQSHPALVREVVPKLISPALLADVLRRLAAEGISLRPLPEILGALADAPPAVRDPATLAERVRAALRRSITFAHAGETGVLAAITLDSLVEDAVRGAIRPSDSGGHLALDPEATRDILAAVARALAAAPAGGPRPVIVAAADLRRYVRRLIEVEHPDLAVLSYAELAPETQIETIARVSV